MQKEDVKITTPDGLADGFIYAPEGNGPWPSVVYLPDGVGIRPAFHKMAERLAAEGFVVLLPNIYYRTTSGRAFDFKPNFKEDKTRQRFMELSGPLTPDAMERDLLAYMQYLKSRPDVSGAMGIVGYCLTGKMAMLAAAIAPDTIAAAASFHGGKLYTDDANSPHKLLPRIKAPLLFGHATNDNSMPADVIAKFEAALAEWGGRFDSETYPAAHGWTVPDDELGVYDEAQAERHYSKLKSFFLENLK